MEENGLWMVCRPPAIETGGRRASAKRRESAAFPHPSGPRPNPRGWAAVVQLWRLEWRGRAQGAGFGRLPGGAEWSLGRATVCSNGPLQWGDNWALSEEQLRAVWAEVGAQLAAKATRAIRQEGRAEEAGSGPTDGECDRRTQRHRERERQRGARRTVSER